MPVVTVRRPGQTRATSEGLVLTNGTTTVTLPLLPDQIEEGGLAAEWSQTPRPGRSPLLVRDATSLKTLRFDADLTLPDRSQVGGIIAALTRLASESKPVTARLGGRRRGLYRITELACPEFAWDDDGQPIEARAILALTEASDVPAKKGPAR